jgi:hypothetical protein
MTGGALVIIARFPVMEWVTSREVLVTKLNQKIASMLHFWVDPSKYFPVHCMKHALVLLEMVQVVSKEGEDGPSFVEWFRDVG